MNYKNKMVYTIKILIVLMAGFLLTQPALGIRQVGDVCVMIYPSPCDPVPYPQPCIEVQDSTTTIYTPIPCVPLPPGPPNPENPPNPLPCEELMGSDARPVPCYPWPIPMLT